MEELLRAEGICQAYNHIAVLDQVSLAANRGECLGVFGLSGAGKTTLLRLLAGGETPDSGTVSSAGNPIGFARQTPFLNGMFTIAEALWLHAALYGIPRGKRRPIIRDVLSAMGLDSDRNRQARSLSTGEQKLLEVARGLLSPGDVFILDEPMADLDFDMRRRVWEYLLRIRAHEEKAVILATSRAEDAELCDRVIMLHQGRVLADGTPAQLRGVVGQEALVVRPIHSKTSHTTKPLWSGIVEFDQDDCTTIEIDPESPPVELLRRIPGDVSAIRMRSRGLDSVLGELIARSRPHYSREK